MLQIIIPPKSSFGNFRKKFLMDLNIFSLRCSDQNTKNIITPFFPSNLTLNPTADPNGNIFQIHIQFGNLINSYHIFHCHLFQGIFISNLYCNSRLLNTTPLLPALQSEWSCTKGSQTIPLPLLKIPINESPPTLRVNSKFQAMIYKDEVSGFYLNRGFHLIILSPSLLGFSPLGLFFHSLAWKTYSVWRQNSAWTLFLQVFDSFVSLCQSGSGLIYAFCLYLPTKLSIPLWVLFFILNNIWVHSTYLLVDTHTYTFVDIWTCK